MRDYFQGWYFKCRNETRTIALIPAYHFAGGRKSCSIQLITDGGSWNVTFPYSDFLREKDAVTIGGNRFSREGIILTLDEPGLKAKGTLRFGPLTPLQYDIMGPFRYVPFMECRHSVYSMSHTVNGALEINGARYAFREGVGYMEGDRGRSFPREYAWTQCCFRDGSVMLSAADIPLWGVHFTGVICAIVFRGREIRLATYLGAKALRIRDGELIVRQGDRLLTVRRLEAKGHPLAAPRSGAMSRIIHETAACRVYYQYQEKGTTLFAFEAPDASFEYEYER